MAWTSVGGVTLEVEVNVTPGKGQMKLTGKLGDVMKESAQAALSCVQSVAGEYGIESDWFETHDIHIHIPEGAVPKDGPSAGITMATAILSAVTNRAVRPDVAMTGEIDASWSCTCDWWLKGKTSRGEGSRCNACICAG